MASLDIGTNLTSSIFSTSFGLLIVVGLIYCFQGFISFVPYFFGLVFKFVFYPITLISQVIYPVGPLVYGVYEGLLFALVFLFIFKMFSKSY